MPEDSSQVFNICDQGKGFGEMNLILVLKVQSTGSVVNEDALKSSSGNYKDNIDLYQQIKERFKKKYICCVLPQSFFLQMSNSVHPKIWFQ